MSETKEGEKYNLYDFTKSIYIFSHMKTLLVDKEVQEFEQKLLAIIQWFVFSICFFVLFKIIIYLFFIIIINNLFIFKK